MEIVFSDKNNASVQLTYLGGCKNYVFEVQANSECFEFESQTSFSENTLLKFREDIISMNKLSCQQTVLCSDDENLRINITSNKYGHLNCVINIKDIDRTIDAELKTEEDLSYLPEIINQTDEVMNQLNNNLNFDHIEIKQDNRIANLFLDVSDMLINENKKLKFLLYSPYFKISRDIEMTNEEENNLESQLNSFINNRKKVSFFPLGEFANFVLCWDNEIVRISGSVCDYQYPYNIVNFNVLGDVKIRSYDKKIKERSNQNKH